MMDINSPFAPLVFLLALLAGMFGPPLLFFGAVVLATETYRATSIYRDRMLWDALYDTLSLPGTHQMWQMHDKTLKAFEDIEAAVEAGAKVCVGELRWLRTKYRRRRWSPMGRTLPEYLNEEKMWVDYGLVGEAHP